MGGQGRELNAELACWMLKLLSINNIYDCCIVQLKKDKLLNRSSQSVPITNGFSIDLQIFHDKTDIFTSYKPSGNPSCVCSRTSFNSASSKMIFHALSDLREDLSGTT